jgi:Uma2 family endonuclease
MDVVLEIGDTRLGSRHIRFPVELRPATSFSVERPGTWPTLPGRLEYVGGRLLFMPPCGDEQQDVAIDLARVLGNWAITHPGFVVGGNEAGMLLGGDARGADAAVWRKASLGRHTGGFRRVPPVLAAEIAGLDEDEEQLRTKVGWYLSHGVEVTWLLLPRPREAVIITAYGEDRVTGTRRLKKHPSLPGLTPRVADFFRQLG